MRVLVTGGAGFIGSHTVEALLGEPRIDEIIVVDNMYSGSPSNLPRDNRIKLYVKDIRDLDDLITICRKNNVEVIIHLAAIVGVNEVYHEPWKGLSINVMGTASVAEAARRTDVSKIIYASSAAVYGEPRYLPIDEDHPTIPVSLYGESKLMGEKILLDYMRDYGIKIASLRYFNVYGPRMRPGPYSGVIHVFIRKLLGREIPVIYGDGSQTRDFVYVEDVAEANKLFALHEYTGVYNVASGTEITINDLYKTICSMIGYCPEPIYGEKRPGDIYRSRASIEKITTTTGWKPKYTLEEGLRKTIEYMSSHK